MICVTLHHKTYEEICTILEDRSIEMAEIRLDLCPSLTDAQIEDLFANCETPLVATSRKNARRLETAIKAGARYADLELEAHVDISRQIQKLCHSCGTELIRSYHNDKETPDSDYLLQVMQRCFRYGADIAKIATLCNTEEDAARLASLYGQENSKGRLIAFGMGEKGRDSRIGCLRNGAPFSYCSLTEEDAVAPGQWPLDAMSQEVYGARQPYLRNGLRMPASKSFAQRAIIAAALADGTSHLSGYTPCDDSEAALKVAEAIGASISRKEDVLEITGIGTKAGDSPAPLNLQEINVGESGLLARMMIPLCSVLNKESIVIDGRGTLLKRPLAGAVNIMAAFGVILSGKSRSGKEITVPVNVKGHVIPGTSDVSGKDGSQLISGLMMALPLCGKPSRVFVGEPKSIPYMYITQDVLGKFGIRLTCEMEGNAEMLAAQDWSYCTGINFHIPCMQRYRAADFRIESDWSSAANFLVAGAIFGGVEIEGLDTSSLQADITVMDILVDAGAVLSVGEEDGSVSVRKAPLESFTADLNHCPDLFPIISVLASFCSGSSRLSGIGRLAGKETNRAEAIVGMLGAMGVGCRIEEDDLVIEGEQLTSRILGGRLLRGGRFSSHSDHRMVMALSVASLGAGSPVEIDDTSCVAKSFPGFRL